MALCGFLCGTWNKSNATKGMVFFLSMCLLVSLLSVAATTLGLVGHSAMGVGQCSPRPKQAESYALGTWDDASAGLHLNWYVCEYDNVSGSTPSGWTEFDGSWYKAFCGWHRYDVAAEKCRSASSKKWVTGAHLVSIKDEAENRFVQQLCGYESCWIGLSEAPHTEDWVWEDGTRMGQKSAWLTYVNWFDGQPNNNYNGDDESVALMNYWRRLGMPNPTIDAGDCPEAAGGVPQPAQPRRNLTGTGRWYDVSSSWRVDYTICERPDTNDGICEKLGWEKYLDSCYHKHCASFNFQEAVAYCEHVGAALVSINSLGENKFVRNLCGFDTCWLGLKKDSGDVWSWEDGTSVGQKYHWVSYVNWEDGEPNNWDDKENAAVMNMNGLVPQMRRGMLLASLAPAAFIVNAFLICSPIVLILSTLCAAKCHSAFCASTLRTATGVMSSLMLVQVFILTVIIPKVDDAWPAGSKLLLSSLGVCGVVQMVLYCCAGQKAQELQWSVSAGFSPMGARAVEPGLSMHALNPEANATA